MASGMASVLPDLQRRAGAVMTQRGGRDVPAHYGSPAGELAICSSGVGLADRSDLVLFSVSGASRSLDQLLTRAVGHSITCGQAAFERGVWWARSANGEEVLVICSCDHAEIVRTTLRRLLPRIPNGVLVDVTDASFVANVIGRRTTDLVRVMGVDIASSQVATSTVGTHNVTWLAEGETGALLITDRACAGAVWSAIELAGRPFGLVSVGLDSVARYRVAERLRLRTSQLV